MKTPKNKHQAPDKLQIPFVKSDLGFGVWSFFGLWNFELGAF
jgi:hypothetical protein